MEVVKTIERLGNSSGKPAAQVRITDCGVTSPPARAAAVPTSPPAAAAGSKRPAESGAANAGKKVNAGDKSPSAVEGIDNPEKNQKKIQLASGLEYVDIKVGTGQMASGGKKIVVGYKGVLKNGFKEFDRSANFNFRLGVGEVIKGWDEGCKGMREGGVRRLLVPSHLGYGRQGAGKDIPPNADLVFEVSLKRVL